MILICNSRHWGDLGVCSHPTKSKHFLCKTLSLPCSFRQRPCSHQCVFKTLSFCFTKNASVKNFTSTLCYTELFQVHTRTLESTKKTHSCPQSHRGCFCCPILTADQKIVRSGDWARGWKSSTSIHLHKAVSRKVIQLKSIKAYATIPKGMMRCACSLLHRQVQEFSARDGRRHYEYLFPRLPFGIVAYAFTLFIGQPLSKQLYVYIHLVMKADQAEIGNFTADVDLLTLTVYTAKCL